MISQNRITVRSKQDIIEFVNRSPHRKMGLLIVFVALGGIFIDAYDFTSISIGNAEITKLFHLSAFELGSVTGIMALGALVGALVVGRFAERFGRNKIFMIDLLLLIVAALGTSLSSSYVMLLVFRFFMGLGVGADLPVALSFIAEFSNLRTKGKYTNFWQGYWYIATVSAGVIDLLLYLAGVDINLWRYAVGFGAVVAAVVLVLRYIYMNESPMWAANNLPLADAAKILQRTYNVEAVVEAEAEGPSEAVTRYPYAILLSKQYRARSILGMTISATQSLQYYAIGFYLPTISAIIFGKALINSISGTILFNVFGILGGFAGAYLTARIHMRKLAIWGFVVVIASLLFAGIYSGHALLWLSALPIATFIFGHSAGPGAQGKTMAANSYPTSLRPMGTGAAEAASRVGNIIGIFFFPIILAASGLSTTLIILIACPLIGLVTTTMIKWDPTGQDYEQDMPESNPPGPGVAVSLD